MLFFLRNWCDNITWESHLLLQNGGFIEARILLTDTIHAAYKKSMWL